jgi:hypothetical protein
VLGSVGVGTGSAQATGDRDHLPRLAEGDGDGDGERPRTGFEKRNGESWTTLEEEREFLNAVAAGSQRMEFEKIGSSDGGRPLQLVRLGSPKPPTEGAPKDEPSVYFIGTQHGNEPAAREALLISLRDLAYTDDSTLVEQMGEQSLLVTPTANPDGRANNTRDNGTMDINRDHLRLTQPETRAIHRVMRDWQPDVFFDHHEYGPAVPVVYDADILYLWPRNLNVDPRVQDLARTLAEEYVGKGARRAGYSADTYGVFKVKDQPITQVAGGPDEGISRNASGLRHSLGILIESAVSQSRERPGEFVSDADNRLRRVNSQVQTVCDALRFMREQGGLAKFASDGASERAAEEGAEQERPTYWGGADNEEPDDDEIDDPPACRYELTGDQLAEVKRAMNLHGINFGPAPGSPDRTWVGMGQGSRPVIPLLLDERANRNEVAGDAVYNC